MFIARQPIFNTILTVYGYELLFRKDLEDQVYRSNSAVRATATVLGGLFETGIEGIVNDKKAFVNFDYEFLMSDAIEIIDPQTLVIEVLEDVKIDYTLSRRLRFLKKKGYKIALDDFELNEESERLIEISDIIKYDIIKTPLDTIKSQVIALRKKNKILLAEKIESNEEYILAKEMGFQLFQGYFFSKPNVVGKVNSQTPTKLQYARLISELRKEEPSYDHLAEIIHSDVNLAYRLVRLISQKSSEDYFYSIKKALVYMGTKEIERWVNILMLQDLSEDKPKELMRLSLIRSKFGEFLAAESVYHTKRMDISLMGLFSTIDAILDTTMEEALKGTIISSKIKEALIEKKGQYMLLYQLILDYEQGEWKQVRAICGKIDLDERKLYRLYLRALKWTNEIMDKMF